MAKALGVMAAIIMGAGLSGGTALGAPTPPPAPWPATTVFTELPARAKPAPGSACVTADRYVTWQSQARQKDLASLFTEDADLIAMSSEVIHGRDALNRYYDKPTARKVIPIAFIDRGRECFMELASPRLDDPDGPYHLAAINHFTMDEKNRIQRLVIYIRPGLTK